MQNELVKDSENERKTINNDTSSANRNSIVQFACVCVYIYKI